MVGWLACSFTTTLLHVFLAEYLFPKNNKYGEVFFSFNKRFK